MSEADILARANPLSQLCGIYFLILAGKVVYVGQSVNVLRRIMDHMGRRRSSKSTKPLIEFDSWASMACSEDMLDVFEQAYLRKLLPKQNKCHMAMLFKRVG